MKKILLQLLIIGSLLVFFNLFIVPYQRDAQLQLDKKQQWRIPFDERSQLAVSNHSLVYSYLDTDLSIFYLIQLDPVTGKETRRKRLPGEFNDWGSLFSFENSIYLVFPNQTLYKINMDNLETVWQIDWPHRTLEFTMDRPRDLRFLSDHKALWQINWPHRTLKMTMERSKDLLFLDAYYYDTFGAIHIQVFIDDNTGDFFEIQTKEGEAFKKTYRTLNACFASTNCNWDRYYHFKAHHFIFDSLSKQHHYIIDDSPVNIENPQELLSFEYGPRNFKNKHSQSSTDSSFQLRRQRIYPLKGFTPAYQLPKVHNEEHPYGGITADERLRIQSGWQHPYGFILTTAPPSASENFPNYTKLQTYSFIQNNETESRLVLRNSLSPNVSCFSNEYFASTNYNSSAQSTIQLVQLRTLKTKRIKLAPEQRLFHLYCNDHQLFVQLKEKDTRNYLVATAFDFES
ncbi:PQQ-like beta-propeller repeat protein [Aureispira anguillae]|uniref:PQQ-like beta-propeller repeat protein n=1 Tax=Aureispira anguillae TaxID=2864201 RepID=A0A916DNK2_9BACT|nr:PQQ-like beta-propeller repeat protein [Aureispira anguillae]BDS09939.1 PQQ-like beta-propeller repeat protein [Aureispira anguillae]